MRGKLIAIPLLLSAAQAGAQRADSAAFIIRLGTDTTAVERYVRTDRQLIAEAVQRSPTTTMHKWTLNFDANGRVASAEYTVGRVAEAQPLSRSVTTFRGDSVVVEITQGGNTRTQRGIAGGAIPIAGPFYFPYELAIMQALQRTGREPVRLVAGVNPAEIRVERVGTDSVALNNQFGEPMRAHVNPRGQILHLNTPAFASVERLRWVELDRFARDFAMRDATGRGMGPLSPRFAVRRRVGEANVWLDYSRPAARGRPIWGGLVPWGRVWRMGANDAAHLATDRTLEIGNLTLAPGTYTLFLLPEPNGWQLVVNRRTGMSGLDYDQSQDVGRTALTVETAPNRSEAFTIDVADGRLVVSWGERRGWVPVRVR